MMCFDCPRTARSTPGDKPTDLRTFDVLRKIDRLRQFYAPMLCAGSTDGDRFTHQWCPVRFDHDVILEYLNSCLQSWRRDHHGLIQTWLIFHSTYGCFKNSVGTSMRSCSSSHGYGRQSLRSEYKSTEGIGVRDSIFTQWLKTRGKIVMSLTRGPWWDRESWPPWWSVLSTVSAF